MTNFKRILAKADTKSHIFHDLKVVAILAVPIVIKIKGIKLFYEKLEQLPRPLDRGLKTDKRL
jgi:hypothetical protein